MVNDSKHSCKQDHARAKGAGYTYSAIHLPLQCVRLADEILAHTNHGLCQHRYQAVEVQARERLAEAQFHLVVESRFAYRAKASTTEHQNHTSVKAHSIRRIDTTLTLVTSHRMQCSGILKGLRQRWGGGRVFRFSKNGRTFSFLVPFLSGQALWSEGGKSTKDVKNRDVRRTLVNDA